MRRFGKAPAGICQHRLDPPDAARPGAVKARQYWSAADLGSKMLPTRGLGTTRIGDAGFELDIIVEVGNCPVALGRSTDITLGHMAINDAKSRQRSPPDLLT
jgi:hypothetical protein